jgi:hypothetical protein
VPARSAVCLPVATPVSASRPDAGRLHPCAMTGRRPNVHGGWGTAGHSSAQTAAKPESRGAPTFTSKRAARSPTPCRGTRTDTRRAHGPRAHSPRSRRQRRRGDDELRIKVDVAWCSVLWVCMCKICRTRVTCRNSAHRRWRATHMCDQPPCCWGLCTCPGSCGPQALRHGGKPFPIMSPVRSLCRQRMHAQGSLFFCEV